MVNPSDVTAASTLSLPDKSDREPATAPPISHRQAPIRSDLLQTTQTLEDKFQIGILEEKPSKHRRYASLRTQALFTTLVNWYTRMFYQQWDNFRRTVEPHAYKANQRDNQQQYAAQVYVSTWFWDLYVSIRTAARKVSGTAFQQHYYQDAEHVSERYDAFLVHINAIIRPTHILYTAEESMWIPIFPKGVNIDNMETDPFSINGWIWNEDLTHAIIDRMSQSNSPWKVETLVSDTLGRPAWLLDWHGTGTNARAYAWFPAEGNFSTQDLLAAYIIGEAITPNLGPRDVDDWQYHQNFQRPAVSDYSNVVRVENRRFFGATEYREIEEQTIPATFITQEEQRTSKKKKSHGSSSTGGLTLEKRKDKESSSEPEAMVLNITAPEDSDPQAFLALRTLDRFRIIDWTYHSMVVLRIVSQQRDRAMRAFIFK